MWGGTLLKEKTVTTSKFYNYEHFYNDTVRLIRRTFNSDDKLYLILLKFELPEDPGYREYNLNLLDHIVRYSFRPIDLVYKAEDDLYMISINSKKPLCVQSIEDRIRKKCLTSYYLKDIKLYTSAAIAPYEGTKFLVLLKLAQRKLEMRIRQALI